MNQAAHFSKLYFIQQVDNDHLDYLEAVFDSREKAEAYNNRYKTNSNFKILTLDYNVEYDTDKTIDPYEIWLPIHGNQAFLAGVRHEKFHTEPAKNEEYRIDTTAYGNYNEILFRIYLFANSKEEAVKKALHIRDTSVSNAEWKEAEEKFSIAKAEALIRKKTYRYKERMLKKCFIASISAIALLLLYIIFR